MWFTFCLKCFVVSDSLRSPHAHSIECQHSKVPKGFVNIHLITNTCSFINLPRWVRVLIFQRKETFNFLTDSLNSHMELSIVELMELWWNFSITTKVHRRGTKVTPHCSSSIPKRYKRNEIHADLCRAKRTSSNFNNEKMLIRLDNADYLSPFTKSVIRGYEHKQNKRQQQEDKYSILPNIFLISKESILVEFPYCPQNELVARRF